MIEIFPTDPEITVDPGITKDGRTCKILSILPGAEIKIAVAIEPEAARTIAAALTAPHPRGG